MRKIFLIFFCLIFLFSCGQKRPTEIEGKGILHVTVCDRNETKVQDAEVFCRSIHGFQTNIRLTDCSGAVTFDNLPSSEYYVVARVMQEGSIHQIGGKKVSLHSGEEKEIEVKVYLNYSGLKINEIYYAGPVNNDFFWGDQFIELYNSSPETIYLDGMIIFDGSNEELAGKDNDNDGSIDFKAYNKQKNKKVYCIDSIFRLAGKPGKTKHYPVEPYSFVVIAKTAKNYKLKYKNSIDLSDADFEFYTPQDINDSDNPDVPNFEYMITGKNSDKTPHDMAMNLKADMIFLATGEDSDYSDGFDINTIIDGVEYIHDKNLIHRLDDRIDRGVAGITKDDVVEKYSGKSIQRLKGAFDTNDSSIDFEIIKPPTPGSW